MAVTAAINEGAKNPFAGRICVAMAASNITMNVQRIAAPRSRLNEARASTKPERLNLTARHTWFAIYSDANKTAGITGVEKSVCERPKPEPR